MQKRTFVIQFAFSLPRLTPITTVTIPALLQKAAVPLSIGTPLAFKPWKLCEFPSAIA
jgi:hypothetical protein